MRITHWVTLGSAIRDSRKAQGLSQHELAEAAGVSRSWIARTEAGHRSAELEQILKVLDALNLAMFVNDPAQTPQPQFTFAEVGGYQVGNTTRPLTRRQLREQQRRQYDKALQSDSSSDPTEGSEVRRA